MRRLLIYLLAVLPLSYGATYLAARLAGWDTSPVFMFVAFNFACVVPLYELQRLKPHVSARWAYLSVLVAQSLLLLSLGAYIAVSLVALLR